MIDKWLSRVSKSFLDAELRKSIETGRGNLKSQYPSDFSESDIRLIETARAWSMTSPERMYTLIRAIEYIETNNINGDIVECGVWRGGSMYIVARKLLELNSSSRNLFLFDTFEGMSAPTEHDVSNVDNKKAGELLDRFEKEAGDNVWCYSTDREVRQTMERSGYPSDKVQLVKGMVENTIPHEAVSSIALLRLDTDWYESTKHELEHLYDLLVPGGVLIIDDYGHWRGAKKAVDEFISERKLRIFLNRIDYTGRLAIKY